jgi:LmbE family N-acetylglucosaminyl deacetylase
MKVLAVGAHWDDIEIGCALTLARLRTRGAKLHGAVLTSSGYTVARDQHARQDDKALAEGRRAFETLGIVHEPTTPLPNQRMTYDQKVMQELEKIAAEREIDLVLTHWRGDLNTDHAATWEISRLAFRRVPSLLLYQSNSYADNIDIFVPHYFWTFTAEEYERKKQLIAMHEGEWQYRRERWQREIFERERFWGHLAGADYAEAFMISRLRDSAELGLSSGLQGDRGRP